MFWMTKRQLLLYATISVVFVIFNALTVSRGLLPWVDEVMFSDTSMNLAQDGEWLSRAWYSTGESAYNTYMPLYNILLAVWVKVFGYTILVFRGFNYVLAAIALYALLTLMNKISPVRKDSSIVLVSILFWCGGTFAQIYREGRPDVLNALLTICFALCVYEYLNEKRKSSALKLIIVSALLILSGLQPLPSAVLILIFFGFAYRRNIRRVAMSVVNTIVGMMCGMSSFLVFTFLHHKIAAFLLSIVQYSGTLTKLCYVFRSEILSLTGEDVAMYVAKPQEVTGGGG